MKLLIVEGQDRCGKDSLISEICSSYSNAIKVSLKPFTTASA